MTAPDASHDLACALARLRAGDLSGARALARSVEEDAAASPGACSIARQVQHLADRIVEMAAEQDAIVADLARSHAALREAHEQLRAESEQRTQMEQDLRLSQKLEAVGQLAAGIAHEINTPTQFVADNTRFLRDGFDALLRTLERFEDLMAPAQGHLSWQQRREAVAALFAELDVEFLKAEVPAAIEQSLTGIGRITTIVRAMKEFSHPGVSSRTEFDVNHGLGVTATIARNEWKHVADLTLDLAPDLPIVRGLPGELNQVFLNILLNAAQALAEQASETRGRIRIATRSVGAGVEIRFEDDGPGIAPEVLDRVFDPFFTTKEVGKGTGQGLAIARAVIVDKHGGSIRCESRDGHGTAFVIELPLG